MATCPESWNVDCDSTSLNQPWGSQLSIRKQASCCRVEFQWHQLCGQSGGAVEGKLTQRGSDFSRLAESSELESLLHDLHSVKVSLEASLVTTTASASLVTTFP